MRLFGTTQLGDRTHAGSRFCNQGSIAPRPPADKLPPTAANIQGSTLFFFTVEKKVDAGSSPA